MQLILVISLLFALLVAVFALQNAAPVAVSFLFWHFETSGALLVLAAAAIGAAATAAFGISKTITQSIMLREKENKLKALEKELLDSREKERQLAEELASLKNTPSPGSVAEKKTTAE